MVTLKLLKNIVSLSSGLKELVQVYIFLIYPEFIIMF
jgi:hypothetical protein